MAHPYTMLWPYLHTVPSLAHPTDMSMFHTAFASHLGTVYNDLDNSFSSEQYISNIGFQQQKHHQQQLQNQQPLQRQNKLLQYHTSKDLYLQKLGYEFNTTNSTPNSNSNSLNLDNKNGSPDDNHKKKNHVKDNENINQPQTPKKGHSFTIDFLLSNDKSKQDSENEDKSSNTSDRRSCSPREATSPSPLSVTNPSIPSLLPLLHSTPNIYHTDQGRLSRRHDRVTEACHPYFHKQFELYSHSQAHQNFQHQQQYNNSYERQQKQHHQQQVSPNVSNHHQNHNQHESSTHRNTFASSSTNSSTSFSSSSSSESATSPGNETKEGKLSNKTKRIRTIFTPEQLERLEAEFERQQYMVGTERFYLASSLNLTEAQVKVWFQNRRIKWRKQHLEQQQARLAQGDLYRDLEESDDSDHEDEAMTAMMSSSQDELLANQSSLDNFAKETDLINE